MITYGRNQSSERAARWAILLALLLILLTWRAYGQEVTLHSALPDGTKLTTKCNWDPNSHTASCSTWESTYEGLWGDLKDLRRYNMAAERYCKDHGLPTSRFNAKKFESCRNAFDLHQREMEAEAERQRKSLELGKELEAERRHQ